MRRCAGRAAYLSRRGSNVRRKAPGTSGSSSRSSVLRVLAPTSSNNGPIDGMSSVPSVRSCATWTIACSKPPPARHALPPPPPPLPPPPARAATTRAGGAASIVLCRFWACIAELRVGHAVPVCEQISSSRPQGRSQPQWGRDSESESVIHSAGIIHPRDWRQPLSPARPHWRR